MSTIHIGRGARCSLPRAIPSPRSRHDDSDDSSACRRHGHGCLRRNRPGASPGTRCYLRRCRRSLLLGLPDRDLEVLPHQPHRVAGFLGECPTRVCPLEVQRSERRERSATPGGTVGLGVLAAEPPRRRAAVIWLRTARA